MHCGYFDTTRKRNHSSFLTLILVGGSRPLPSEICTQSDLPLRKCWLRQISAYNVSTVRDGEKVQLWRIGRRLRAFQRAIDGVRTLPLCPTTGGSKGVSCFFINKIQLQSNKVCYKWRSFVWKLLAAKLRCNYSPI